MSDDAGVSLQPRLIAATGSAVPGFAFMLLADDQNEQFSDVGS
jgi:hypothetical protein